MSKPTNDPVLYESFHQEAGHFSFGRNWQSFLKSLSGERMEIAQASLVNFLGGKDKIKGKSFIDIGCGSGIFSLAAYRLGAKEVVSVDIDQSSIACAQFLHQQEGAPKNWRVVTGSALRAQGLKKLGTFDIVYSWGVLHHTGSMYEAITNASRLVAPDGRFYISIYHHSKSLRHGTSHFWHWAKQRYNQSPVLVKKIAEWVYSSYLFLGLAASGKNPFSYIRNYQSARGMSWKHDILDWLGGYPYEFATPQEIVSFMSGLGFTVTNTHLVNSIGCSEYLFVRNKPVKDLPAVTVLMSVHNNAKTLEKTLKSLVAQTLVPHVLCVNDASTDGTAGILQAWQKKAPGQLTVLTNTTNLGLTKSLNKGLSQIKTPYTARIDADDWWEPTKLEKQVNFLESNPEYGVMGCYYTNHSHKKSTFNTPPMTDAAIRRVIINLNPFAHSCVIFRTPFIRNLGGYDETVRYGQDYELWMRALPKTKFFNLPENLCHRSFTGGISIEKQHDQMKYAIQTRLKYIRQYKLPLTSYLSVVEPWIVRVTPRWLADAKRKMGDR